MRPERVNTSLPSHHLRVRTLLLAPRAQCSLLLELLFVCLVAPADVVITALDRDRMDGTRRTARQDP